MYFCPVINRFKLHIANKFENFNDQRLLLAFSGGLDSRVLLELLCQAQIKFSVAHCNFDLRADASEADAHFCAQIAEQHQLPFFSKKFDRVQVAPGYYHKNGVSPGLKDINDYAKDFFIYYKNIYETYGKRILVNVDSAALAFIKVLQKIQKQNNYHWLVIKGTNKAKKVSKYGAIESRIVVTNLLLGAGRLEIHEDNEDLLQAFVNFGFYLKTYFSSLSTDFLNHKYG